VDKEEQMNTDMDKVAKLEGYLHRADEMSNNCLLLSEMDDGMHGIVKGSIDFVLGAMADVICGLHAGGEDLEKIGKMLNAHVARNLEEMEDLEIAEIS
jgi:hypothetical protein